ncbi:hypothetical protein [Ectopseudomonas toyotomiensis]|uniref:Uncharacterized protein n=1 Tax=Ectopseudomonas toyotomiensis TaxID=554344 RepID=A0AA42LJG5_9GAMM|nr:hypothetical protein [Pseudomonas toyotomiensis]MBG0840961.1 hypothetical protein [Pseudomonas toyotomiensis]MDH0704447.1 hypothetical protein [Pseudomonas toyotomiensis]
MAVSFGTLLAGAARGLLAVLPFLRRGKAEREAGINPASADDGRVDDLLDGALRRLGALTADDSLLQKALSNGAAIFVRPDHFFKPHIREWLSLPHTKEALKELAKAHLVDAPLPINLRESLIDSYMQISGEQKTFAEDCVSISIAFLKASVEAAATDAGGRRYLKLDFSLYIIVWMV